MPGLCFPRSFLQTLCHQVRTRSRFEPPPVPDAPGGTEMVYTQFGWQRVSVTDEDVLMPISGLSKSFTAGV